MQNSKVQVISQKLLILWLTFAPTIAFAQSSLKNLVRDPLREVAEKALLIKKNTTAGSPLDLFGLYLSLMLAFVGVVFIVEVVHGGYLWMTAGGNEEQIKKAIKKITNGATGAAVVFFAYLITAFALNLITEAAKIDAGFTQP